MNSEGSTLGELNSGCLGLGAEATGADIEPLGLAMKHNGLLVDVGQPSAIGPALGMADVVAEASLFTAKLTFHCKFL